MPRASRLARLLDELEALHGKPVRPRTRDPFELVLWENVAYLADDRRRARAFAALAERIGLAPRAIAAARIDALIEIAALGGIFAEKRAERIHESARLALATPGFERTIASGGAAARRLLKRFPAIGEPGAEKILLLAGVEPVLALDSNALRVLLRLGYGEASSSYARSHRSARDAASVELPATVAARRRAHALLRTHGQHVCNDKAPRCGACPLADRCAYAAALG